MRPPLGEFIITDCPICFSHSNGTISRFFPPEFCLFKKMYCQNCGSESGWPLPPVVRETAISSIPIAAARDSGSMAQTIQQKPKSNMEGVLLWIVTDDSPVAGSMQFGYYLSQQQVLVRRVQVTHLGHNSRAERNLNAEASNSPLKGT
jgi:hypothetical protein